MLSCSIWFSAPSFWMGGGPEGRCVGLGYGADGAVPSHGAISTGHTKAQLLSRKTCYLLSG